MNTEKVMEVLGRVEWVGLPGDWPYCPVCTSWRHKGHRDDCKLAALLSEGDEEAMEGKCNQKLVKELNKVHKEIKELNEAAKEYQGALREARKQIRNPSSNG